MLDVYLCLYNLYILFVCVFLVIFIDVGINCGFWIFLVWEGVMSFLYKRLYFKIYSFYILYLWNNYYFVKVGYLSNSDWLKKEGGSGYCKSS